MSSEGSTHTVSQDVAITPGKLYSLTGMIKVADYRGQSVRIEIAPLNDPSNSRRTP